MGSVRPKVLRRIEIPDDESDHRGDDEQIVEPNDEPSEKAAALFEPLKIVSHFGRACRAISVSPLSPAATRRDRAGTERRREVRGRRCSTDQGMKTGLCGKNAESNL